MFNKELCAFYTHGFMIEKMKTSTIYNRLTSLLLLALPIAATAQPRQSMNLKNWQFSRDSISYSAVTIPHDWAINGPFDKLPRMTAFCVSSSSLSIASRRRISPSGKQHFSATSAR